MPSENYRYYCLDSMGRLHDPAWIKAASDEDAIAQVSAKHPDSKCEIWQGKRLVASLAPARLQAWREAPSFREGASHGINPT